MPVPESRILLTRKRFSSQHQCLCVESGRRTDGCDDNDAARHRDPCRRALRAPHSNYPTLDLAPQQPFMMMK